MLRQLDQICWIFLRPSFRFSMCTLFENFTFYFSFSLRSSALKFYCFLNILQSPYYPLENYIWFSANSTHGFEIIAVLPNSKWSFGDGGSANGYFDLKLNKFFVYHKYKNPGVYNVSLNVSNICNTVLVQSVMNYDLNGDFTESSYIIVQRYNKLVKNIVNNSWVIYSLLLWENWVFYAISNLMIIEINLFRNS